MIFFLHLRIFVNILHMILQLEIPNWFIVIHNREMTFKHPFYHKGCHQMVIQIS